MLLGRKTMTNLDSILKTRDITLPTKAQIFKAGFFSSHVWMWELNCKKGWALKTDAFELWYWRRLLWMQGDQTSYHKRNQPWIFIEGLMLKLKCQYFGSLMQSPDSLKTTLMLGKIEGRRWGDGRGWDSWVASPTQWTWVWANFWNSERQGSLACYSPWGHKEWDMTELLSNNSNTFCHIF